MSWPGGQDVGRAPQQWGPSAGPPGGGLLRPSAAAERRLHRAGAGGGDRAGDPHGQGALGAQRGDPWRWLMFYDVFLLYSQLMFLKGQLYGLWPGYLSLSLSFSPLSLSLSYVLPTWESLGRGGQLRKDAEVMANPMSENIGFLPSHMETRIVTFLHFVMFWLFCFCSNPILEFQGIISIVSGSPLVWLEPLEHSILSLQLPARYLFSLLDAMESNGLPADPYLTSLSAAVREKGSCPRGWRGRVS
jgi:hypothetical protein